MTDQPIPPADEPMSEVTEFSNGAQEISPRVKALIRYHETGGHEGRGDVTLDEAQQALSYLTRPSPVVDGLSAELAALVETGTALPVHGQPYRTFELDEPLRDRIRTALAMRPAPDAVLRERDLQAALDLALLRLTPYEPGDSRAVSDEFVAMASVAANLANDAAREIIDAALASPASTAEGEASIRARTEEKGHG